MKKTPGQVAACFYPSLCKIYALMSLLEFSAAPHCTVSVPRSCRTRLSLGMHTRPLHRAAAFFPLNFVIFSWGDYLNTSALPHK